MLPDLTAGQTGGAPGDATGQTGGAPEPPAPGGLLAPGVLVGGRYRVVGQLGRGGFAETYLAHDTRLFDAPCVVKHLLLPAGETSHAYRVASLAREAELLVQLKTPGHPHIPEVYEYLADERCLVMKYVEGRSLREAVRAAPGGLPEAEVLRYARAVCAALAYMHARGVMHLDIKPDNLLLDTAERLWVIDFGIGRATAAPGAAAPVGTPGFTPPEQWRGGPAPASDIYALAATMWALLTRRPPELAPAPQALLAAGASARPELVRLIALGLAADPADRPTAQEFLGELEALIAPEHIPPPPAPRPPPLPRGVVGRAAELDLLEACLRAGRLALVTGLAGVGKTTLGALLARRQAEERRIFWHTFHPGEDGAVVIWHLAAFLAAHGYGDLWRLHHRAPYGDSPRQIAELRCDYAARALRGRGFLICLDDLHTVEHDPLVRRLLLALAEGRHAGNGALLLLSRHVPPLPGLDTAEALGGLTMADTAALLASRGLALDDNTLTHLHTSTEGNAQLLTLAIDALRHAGAPDHLVERLASAANIERFLLSEVDAQLADEERELLMAAALLGHGFTRDALAAALGRPVGRRALHDLVRRNLVATSGVGGIQEYGLHAMMQAFYYEELAPPERAAMHRRAAAHYESAEPARLLAARHYLLAGEAGRAAELALASTWEAISQGRTGELGALLARLQIAALAPARRGMIAAARGDLHTLLREGEAARARYDEALATLAGLPPGAERAALSAAVYLGLGELLEQADPAEAMRWLELGLRETPPGGEEEAALLLRAGSVLMGAGDNTRAREAIERAMGLLPPGASRLRGSALHKLGALLCGQGESERGQACYREALAIYEEQGNHWGKIGLQHNLALERELGGDWAGAEGEYLAALELAERLGNVSRVVHIELSLGILQMNRGDLPGAARYLESGLAKAAAREMRELEVAYLSSLADLHLRAGAHTPAEERLAEAERLALAVGSRHQLPEIARGWALLLRGRDAPGAVARAREAVALARELEDAWAEGVCLRVLGQALEAAGEGAGAGEAFAASEALLAELDPYETARTRLAWAPLLRAAGDHERAGALLAAARARFATLGAALELRQADET